jgi:hypothetical protein
MNTQSTQATVLALSLLAMTTAGVAQNKVVPPHLTNIEGTGFFDLPYVYNAGRHQQIWEGPAVCASTALITRISFRRDTNSNQSTYPSITFPKTVVRLGTTPVTPAKMSTTFATNLVGATMTTIMNGVNYVLPKQITYPGAAPFNIHYPTSAPFLFQRNKGGNLIMEWIHPGQLNKKQRYTLDGEVPNRVDGYVRPFGSFGKFSGGDKPTFRGANDILLLPNGKVSLTISPLKQAYTAAAFFGLSNSSWAGLKLPFDLGVLGAASNTLYTGRQIELPMPVTAAKNGYVGAVSFNLPTGNAFTGYKLYAQAWFADAKANSLGVVASSALELTVGTGNPYTQQLASAKPAAATGFFPKGNMKFAGPVVLLTGAIN